jgi:methyl-accepting chemotaxis protein
MLNFFSNLSIEKKISFGFILCLFILSSSILTTVYFVKKTETINKRLVELRIPTANVTLSMLNGVNHSLAALRGWIILGKPKFKDQRKLAWKTLNENILKMEEYSKNWTNPNNVEISKKLISNFKEFSQFQTEIENVANSIDNTPAVKILMVEAAPKANIMLESITNVINIESKLPATKERKKLLGIMADVRGTTARSLANIRAFLLSGDQKFQKRFQVMWTKNRKRVNQIKAKKGLFAGKQRRELNKYLEARNKFKNLPKRMFDIRNGDSWNLANKWLGTKAAPIAFKIKNLLATMAENQTQLMNNDGAESSDLVGSLLTIEYWILGIGTALILLFNFIVMSSVKGTLNEITNKMIQGMEKITGLASRIDFLGSGLSASSEQQAASMEETSSTMNEIDAMVTRNMEESNKSSTLASDSFTEVNSGADKIKEMINAVVGIQACNEKIEMKIDASNEKMSEIVSIIRTIGEKTKVIDDIVFQTKLLSFNASVEAARAGEHGKGFSVVAEEVGNLAQMSGKASTEICDMLETSVVAVGKVGEEQKREMEVLIAESRKSIQHGINLGEESRVILESIVSNIDSLQGSIKEIASASAEQSSGVTEISKAIVEVNNATRENSRMSHESATISSDLNENILDLNTVLDQLSSSEKDERVSSREVEDDHVSEDDHKLSA